MNNYKEHTDWLFEMKENGVISQEMLARSLLLWEIIRNKMPVPSSAAGPDGQMFYCWDKGRHHLEAEIFPDVDMIDLYYRDRESKESVLEEYILGTEFPNNFKKYFELFYEQ